MTALPPYSPNRSSTGSRRWAEARGRQLVLLVWLGLLSLAAHGQRPIIGLDFLTGGPTSDPTHIYFEQGTTTGFDADLDAAKVYNSSGLNLASFESGGRQLSINGLPPSLLTAPLTVRLFVGVPAYGPYTLQVSQLDNFATTNVYLFDELLDTSSLLALGTTYTFDQTADNTNNTYTTSTRFALQFVPVAAPLPVTLTDFTAVAQPAAVRVGWRTASERRSAYFAVERSRDGQTFREIGRVTAAGSSLQAHTYALLDAQPLAGAAYYRLRQVDADGSFAYSPVRIVSWQPALGGLSLFPSPAHAAATLLGAAPGVLVQVLDALGRLVATTIVDANGTAALVLPLGLAGGLYVVRAGPQAAHFVVE